MEFLLQIDNFVWIALLLLLPILIMPVFVGCSLLLDPDDVNSSDLPPPRVVLEIVPIFGRLLVAEYAANRETAVSQRIQRVLPHGDNGDVSNFNGPIESVRLIILFDVTVGYSANLDITQPSENSFEMDTVFTPIFEDSSNNRIVDWAANQGQLNSLMQSIMVNLPDPMDGELEGNIQIEISGGIDETGADPIPLFRASGSFPVPADLLTPHNAYFSIGMGDSHANFYRQNTLELTTL